MHQSDVKNLETEKVDSNFVEDAANPYFGLSPDDAEFMRQYDGKAGKRVVRKVSLFQLQRFEAMKLIVAAPQIDLRLIPIMGILYLLAHIDRGNIGNAKIEGMGKDLGLTGNQYNIASTIFFVPYIIFGTWKTRPLLDLG